MTTTRAARRATAVRTPWGSGLARAVAAAVSAVLVVVVSVAVAQAETVAEVTTFEVNSTGVTMDTEPGDGTCQAQDLAPGDCTLRAAVEESNALGAQVVAEGGTVEPGQVRVVVAAEVHDSAGIAVTIDPTVRPVMGRAPASWMTTTQISQWDLGAAFEITSPVTIDLGNRLAVKPGTGTAIGAMFHVNAPDVQLLNFTDVFGTGTSIVMGPNAERVLVKGGSSDPSNETTGGRPTRFILFREGATDIKVSQYALRGFGTRVDSPSETPGSTNSAATEGLFVFNAWGDKNRAIKDIVIDEVSVRYPSSSSSTCTSEVRTGCSTSLTLVSPREDVKLDGFSFTNSMVQDMGHHNGFQFSNAGQTARGVTLSRLDISRNMFLGITGSQEALDFAFIVLPNRPLGAHEPGEPSRIERNVFMNNGVKERTSSAIFWDANKNIGNTGELTSASDLVIADNHFDGWGNGRNQVRELIRVEEVGSATIARNTIGSSTTTSNVHHNSPYNQLISVMNSNGKMRAWTPVGEATAGSAPSDEVYTAVGGRLPWNKSQCWASVDVTSGDSTTGANWPTTEVSSPVTLDVFWTLGTHAELYLGSASVPAGSGTTATVEFPVPMGQFDLPTGFAGLWGSVDTMETDGVTPKGKIRLQTHVEHEAPVGAPAGYRTQVASSQLSNPVPLTGDCSPVLSVAPSTDQAASTMARDLHFTVASSQPLDADTLGLDDLALDVEGTEGATVDPNLLDPRFVGDDLTEVEGSYGRLFDVAVRVNDSAQVQVRGPLADEVTSAAGLTNKGDASTSDVVEFVNPLEVRPSTLLVLTGDTRGERYQMHLKSGAPTLEHALEFAAAPGAVGVEEARVSVRVDEPTITPDGHGSSGDFVVTAEGEVPRDTRVAISHTLITEDADYRDLIVPSLTVRLFSTDPTLSITKTAYTGMTDPRDVDTIRGSGGQLRGTGARLPVGEVVCFVYTVTNVSGGSEWEGALSGIEVKDTDKQLGAGGVVGEKATLEVGETVEFSACRTLVAEDTTVTAGGGESSDG